MTSEVIDVVGAVSKLLYMDVTPIDERFVRRALGANATFSLLSGISLALFGGSLAPVLGVELSWVLRIIGGGLLLFALGVAFVARRAPLLRSGVAAITLMDLGWVLGTLGLALLWPAALNTTGWIAAVLVAFAVALFGATQHLGIRRLRNIPGGALMEE